MGTKFPENLTSAIRGGRIDGQRLAGIKKEEGRSPLRFTHAEEDFRPGNRRQPKTALLCQPQYDLDH